jgi:hypothetical protein
MKKITIELCVTLQNTVEVPDELVGGALYDALLDSTPMLSNDWDAFQILGERYMKEDGSELSFPGITGAKSVLGPDYSVQGVEQIDKDVSVIQCASGDDDINSIEVSVQTCNVEKFLLKKDFSSDLKPSASGRG